MGGGGRGRGEEGLGGNKPFVEELKICWGESTGAKFLLVGDEQNFC